MKFFNCLAGVLALIFLVACSSAPKKEVIVIDKAPSAVLTVLKPADQESYLAGVKFMQGKDYVSAANIFSNLLVSYPDLVGAHVNLAIINQQEGRVDLALEGYEKALEVNPNSLAALIQSAVIFQDKGAFTKAETKLRRALVLKEDSAVVNYNLGVLYELYLQEYDLAIKHYQAYIKLSQNEDVKTVERWIKLLERR